MYITVFLASCLLSIGYPDPLTDAPPKYRKRIAELFGLVSGTIRNEKDYRSKSKIDYQLLS